MSQPDASNVASHLRKTDFAISAVPVAPVNEERGMAGVARGIQATYRRVGSYAYSAVLWTGKASFI